MDLKKLGKSILSVAVEFDEAEQEESLKPQQTPDKQTPLKKEVEEEKYSRGAVDSKYESELIFKIFSLSNRI